MDIREARRLGEAVWEIPRRDPMRVPARIYALETMLPAVFADKAPDQVVNVAQLPGIVHAALAMPDIHQGYGFPIGGVAAFDPEDGGVVSPGGVGYDINCGVRLMASRLKAAQVRPRLKAVIEALFRGVPAGVGSESARRLSRADLRRAAVDGARWSVEQGFGSGTDLERIEENGRLDGADPDAVSAQAWERAEKQVGTLGAGN
ncbi:MAG: RtcB family protein, partial [Lentisphaerae bacterium]|nr:RtcB family protein [Lentisphaerota bacterium]